VGVHSRHAREGLPAHGLLVREEDITDIDTHGSPSLRESAF
jgi:hypothetical protein